MKWFWMFPFYIGFCMVAYCTEYVFALLGLTMFLLGSMLIGRMENLKLAKLTLLIFCLISASTIFLAINKYPVTQLAGFTLVLIVVFFKINYKPKDTQSTTDSN